MNLLLTGVWRGSNRGERRGSNSAATDSESHWSWRGVIIVRGVGGDRDRSPAITIPYWLCCGHFLPSNKPNLGRPRKDQKWKNGYWASCCWLVCPLPPPVCFFSYTVYNVVRLLPSVSPSQIASRVLTRGPMSGKVEINKPAVPSSPLTSLSPRIPALSPFCVSCCTTSIRGGRKISPISVFLLTPWI